MTEPGGICLWCSPKLRHAIHELLLAKLALGGGAELPRHDQHRDAGGVEREVIAKLLNAVYPDLVFILGIYHKHNMWQM